MTILKILAGLVSLVFLPGTAAADQTVDADLWNRIEKGGYVLLLQHAGARQETKTSTNLRNSNCSKRDELTKQGQLQAQRLKTELERRKIPIARVLTGHDCRNVQTAALAFGRAEPWNILDLTPARRAADNQGESAALREAIRRWSSSGNLVLISHSSVFQDALGASPETAQLLVIEPLGDGNYSVIGRLRYQ